MKTVTVRSRRAVVSSPTCLLIAFPLAFAAMACSDESGGRAASATDDAAVSPGLDSGFGVAADAGSVEGPAQVFANSADTLPIVFP
jgi:hypothetical protein